MTLDGIGRLLIDGNNLLHRVSGSTDPAALRLLLARLNSALPASLPTIVMLDGHAAPGTDRRQRIRRGLDVHHAGSISGDDALLYLIRDVAPFERGQLTLVTDDRALGDKARYLGARTQRLAWLEAVLDGSPAGRSGGVSIGGGRRRTPEPPTEQTQEERQPWQPGRGATRKRGNPRRAPRRGPLR